MNEMKLLIRKLTIRISILLLIVLSSCSKDEFNYDKDLEGLSKVEGLINLSLTSDNATTSKSSLEVNNFTVNIFNSSNEKIKGWDKYSLMPEKIKLNVANYKLQAFYGDSLATGFDIPYYCGVSNFNVIGQSVTPVSVVCKLANVGVKVKWGKNIQQNYSKYSVSIYRNGYADSLKYNEVELRSGYIPAGTLKLKIYLTDKNGVSRVISTSTLDIKANSNDFINLTIDTKSDEPTDLDVSFVIDTSVELKTIQIVIPGSLKPKKAPEITCDDVAPNYTYNDFEGVPLNMRININSPAYLERLILRTNSYYIRNTLQLPAEIDLLDCTPEIAQKLTNAGLIINQIQGTKYSFVDFDNLIANITYIEGNNNSSFELEAIDSHGQKGNYSFSTAPKQVILSDFNINNLVTRSYYSKGSFNTNLTKDLYTLEINDGNGWKTTQFNIIDAVNTSKNIILLSLASSTAYSVRLKYKYRDNIVTNEVAITTENAQPLLNETFDNWTETQIYGGNGTFSGKIVCDYVAGWSTLNDKTTYGAKDCGGVSNYGTNWRFCSGTIATDDRTIGTKAAEISTLAFYNNSVSGSWKRASVYNYTRDNGTAYPGLLFLGTIDAASGNYTLGIPHDSRPESLSFDYKYTPIEEDKCIIYAKVYGESGTNELATTIVYNSALQGEYRRITLAFDYINEIEKATKITVFFQSGTVMDITKMVQLEGSFNTTPYTRDRVVGSVLKIDNVKLNY